MKHYFWLDNPTVFDYFFTFPLKMHNYIQYKPLNMITLGQTKIDNINRMITITGCFYLINFSEWEYEM